MKKKKFSVIDEKFTVIDVLKKAGASRREHTNLRLKKRKLFHAENQHIAKLLLTGNFGLERETLRVTEDGRLSHTDHPFDADDIFP